MSEKIGIIAGMETTFPAAFIEKVNQTPGFKAEMAVIGPTRAQGFDPDYRVIVDRLSHEVEFYRYHLKAAALAGTYVINDPFWWSADEKFFGFSLAAKLGVSVPKTVMLPQRSYIPSINPQKSLRNLEFPVDWEAICNYVGFPAILKPADGGGWRGVTKVNNFPELMKAYNESGTSPMTLQEFIDFDEYVRCICIGKEYTHAIKYDPKLIGRNGTRGAYLDVDGFMPKALEQKVLDGAWAINHALGYDMNSIEFACKEGVAYAIDFTNPAPDMDLNSIGPKHFNIAVDAMAKFVIQAAREGRRNHDGYAWRRYLDNPTQRPAGLNEYVKVA